MLDTDTVLAIKAELALGEKTQTAIAKSYGVSRGSVYSIANGKAHKDVPWPKVGPLTTSDVRTEDLQAEVVSLKQDLLKAKREVKAVYRQHGLFKAIVDEIQHIKPLNPLKSDFQRKRKSQKNESLVMHLSDGHHDEIVLPEECGGLEEYNFAISCRRAERYVDTMLDFTLNSLSNYHFSDLTILAYGDHTSGEIHGACERSAYRNMFQNSIAIGKLHASMIRDLAPHYRSVNVLYVPGNHGRRSAKKDHHGPHDNWDYLIGKIAETYCRNIPNVSFTIPNSFHAYVEINDNVFAVSHGDDVKGTQGIPAYSLLRRHGSLVRLAQVRNTKPVRYTVIGHHHLATSIRDMDGGCLINGAWVGTNAYSFNSFAGYREPTQLIHGVHHKHGVTWKLDVQLRGDDDQAGPKRYNIEV